MLFLNVAAISSILRYTFHTAPFPRRTAGVGNRTPQRTGAEAGERNLGSVTSQATAATPTDEAKVGVRPSVGYN